MSFEQDHRIPMATENELELDEEYRYEGAARRRFPGVLVGLVIAAVLIGGAFWWGYDLGDRGDDGIFPPLIQADRAPIREAPAEPGGLQVPNQESLVFDGVAGDENAVGQSVTLATPPEEPLARSDAQRTAQPAEDIAPLAAARVLDTTAGTAQEPAGASDVPPPPPPLAREDLSATLLRPAGQAEPSQPGPPVEEPIASNTVSVEPLRTAPLVEAPTPPPALAAPAETQTAAVASTPEVVELVPPATGAFRVQVGAYRTEAGALNGWNILQPAHEALLGDLSPTIVSVDLGARGVFHRLQAGPLADRGAADTLCNSLKARNQGCLVVGP